MSGSEMDIAQHRGQHLRGHHHRRPQGTLWSNMHDYGGGRRFAFEDSTRVEDSSRVSSERGRLQRTSPGASDGARQAAGLFRRSVVVPTVAPTGTTAPAAPPVVQETANVLISRPSNPPRSAFDDAAEAGTTESLLKFFSLFLVLFCCVVGLYGVYANVEMQEDRNGERKFVDRWLGRFLFVAPRRSRNRRSGVNGASTFNLADSVYGAGRRGGAMSFQDRMTAEERISLQELKEAVLLELDGADSN